MRPVFQKLCGKHDPKSQGSGSGFNSKWFGHQTPAKYFSNSSLKNNGQVSDDPTVLLADIDGSNSRSKYYPIGKGDGGGGMDGTRWDGTVPKDSIRITRDWDVLGARLES